MLEYIIKHSKWVLNNRGGGSKTEIVSAPPAPSAEETSEDIYKSRLKYDPQVAQLEYDIQKQFLPQQTQLYSDLSRTYTPLVSQALTDVQKQQLPQLLELQKQLFPQQSQVLEAGAGQALKGLQNPNLANLQEQSIQSLLNRLLQPQTALQQRVSQSAMEGLTPTGITPEQQAAIDAIRQRQVEQTQKYAREQGQLGGQLFGGRTEQLEQRGVNELLQSFAKEDVDRLLQNILNSRNFALQAGGQEQSALQNAISNAFSGQQYFANQAQPYLNILFPQAGTQQAQVSPFQFTSATPSADAQLNAVTQLLGQQTVIPGQASPLYDLLGQISGSFLGNTSLFGKR